MQACYCKWPSLTLEEGARFVPDLIGRLNSSSSAGPYTSPHVPLKEGDCLDENDRRDSCDLLTSNALDEHSPLEADFDRLCIAGKQAGKATPGRTAYIVTLAEASSKWQQKLTEKWTQRRHKPAELMPYLLGVPHQEVLRQIGDVGY